MGEWTGYRGGPTRTAAVADGRPVRDAHSGERWAVGLAGGDVLSNGIRVADGQVYVGRTDGLSVLDAATGQQVWRYTEAAPACGFFVDSVEYEDDDRYVVLATPDGVVQLKATPRGTRPYTVDSTVDCEIDADIGAGGALCNPPEAGCYYVTTGVEGERDLRAVQYEVHPDDPVIWAPDLDGSVVPPLSADYRSLVSSKIPSSNVYIATSEQFPEHMADTVTITEGVGALDPAYEIPIHFDLSPPIVPTSAGIYIWDCVADSTVLYEEQSYQRIELGPDGAFESAGISDYLPDAPPVVTDDGIYCTAEHGAKLTATTLEGALRWETEIPGRSRDVTGPVAVGDVVYLGTENRLLGYDTARNRVVDRRFDSQITALAGAATGVYVGTEGAVYALTDTETSVYDGAD
ncbi:PQQ-binding-like beta-propeller repeat protein [Halobellus ordinarius]|uniref:outer membrane protein assembly factor BamB family protein n=1 Tax=Halobellus ordinarius TaxID=3075120 RepID=UPI0028800B02|nr:PQQ-binding-like beta-propeller repeat protein [Halobellus sp. ZY16]